MYLRKNWKWYKREGRKTCQKFNQANRDPEMKGTPSISWRIRGPWRTSETRNTKGKRKRRNTTNGRRLYTQRWTPGTCRMASVHQHIIEQGSIIRWGVIGPGRNLMSWFSARSLRDTAIHLDGTLHFSATPSNVRSDSPPTAISFN